MRSIHGLLTVVQEDEVPTITDAPEARAPRPRYEFLDGLRAIAIIGVILVHVGFLIPNLGKIVHPISVYGGRGVELFFIVSGFTLSLNYRNRDYSNISFFIKRYFRIAPMFYLAGAFYIISGIFISEIFFVKHANLIDIMATMTFLHGWSPYTIHSIVPGGWSIAAEMMFYITFPFLLMYLTNIKRYLLACLVSFVVSYGCEYGIQHIAGDDATVHSFSNFFWISQYPAFVLGCGAPLLVPILKEHKILNKFIVYLMVPAIFLAIYIAPSFRVADILFVILVTYASIKPSRILENRFLVLLGRLSFSVYLVHFAVLAIFRAPVQFFTRFLGNDLTFIFTAASVLLFSIFVSLATYQWIEMPMIRLGNWIADTVSPKHLSRQHVARMA